MKHLLFIFLFTVHSICIAQLVNNLNQLGLDAANKGEYEKAISYFEQAIAKAKRKFGAISTPYANSMNNLANLYHDLGKYGKAEPLYVETKKIRAKVLGNDHPIYATALNNLATLYGDQGLYAKAEPLFIEAIEIRAQSQGKEHPNYANSLNNLASLYYHQGLYAKAEPLYMEAKTIRANTLGKDNLLYASSLFNLANLYHAQGLYTKAEPLYVESKDIKAKSLGKNHLDYIETLYMLARLYYDQGLYAKAEPLFVEAKEIIAQSLGEDHPHYATLLNNLASLYSDQGLYAKAEPLFIEAIEIRAQFLGEDHTNYAISLNSLALLYQVQGLYAKAEPLYVESNEIIVKVLGKDHPYYASSLNNLALLYQVQGQYAKAEELHMEAKENTLKALGKDHLDYANSLNNMAYLYMKQGHYAKAEPMYIEATEIYAQSVGKGHPSYATSLNNLALLYKYEGQYAKAEPLFMEAKEIRAQSLGKNHPNYAESLIILAGLYLDFGLYAKAEPLFMEANEIFLTQINRNFAQLSEKEKEKYFKTFSFNFEVFHSFLLKRYPDNHEIISENYNNILATKGLLFQSNQKIKRAIQSSGDATLIQTYKHWQTQRSYLSTLYEKTISEREKMGVKLEEEEIKANSLEKQLSALSTEFATVTDNTRYNWKDIKNALNDDEASIELVRFKYYENEWTDSVLYIAMIVTPGTINHPELVVLPNGNELEAELLQSYRASLYYSTDSDIDIRGAIGNYESDNFSDLYTAYWRPIQEKLEGIRKIYLSADGVFNTIGLEGLFDTENKKYVGDEMTIHRITSTRDLVKKQEEYSVENTANLLGYPAYNDFVTSTGNNQYEYLTARANQEKKERSFMNGEDISLLPGTRKEIETLNQILQQSNISTTVYMENKANEEAIKNWDSPRIAHIATHGFFFEDVEIEKKDFFFGGTDKNTLYENPLLRSGLLLANAKQALTEGGDGVLTAYEAANLNLEGTELVVLSACETGLGEIKNGEGVYGLQRAFQTAGARSVLMSLWSVDDDATQELMVEFYTNWLVKGQEKREALKNAKLSLRQQEKYQAPFYWSGFVMIGE